jgi:hypothetical protein
MGARASKRKRDEGAGGEGAYGADDADAPSALRGKLLAGWPELLRRGPGGIGWGRGGGAAGAGGPSADAQGASGGQRSEGAPEDNDDAAPSELLAPLLDEWREVLVKHVLERLDPNDVAMLAQVGKPWLAVVVANNLPRAGKVDAPPLKPRDFLVSVKLLAWAKANGCPWDERVCETAISGGHLAGLQWARGHGCPWRGYSELETAAAGGHLEVLKWLREQGCAWEEQTCNAAARGGHLECWNGPWSMAARGLSVR